MKFGARGALRRPRLPAEQTTLRWRASSVNFVLLGAFLRCQEAGGQRFIIDARAANRCSSLLLRGRCSLANA